MKRAFAILALSLTLALFLGAGIRADTIVGFSAPNTHSGQQGADNLVAHGAIHPAIGVVKNPAAVGRTYWPHDGHWRAGSAFYHSSSGKFIVGANLEDVGTWGGSEPFRYSSLWIGRSPNGLNFQGNWQELVYTIPDNTNFRITNLSLIPHPTDPNKLTGFVVSQTSSGFFRLSRVEVDMLNNRVRIGHPGNWVWVTFGAYLPYVPSSISNGYVNSVQYVGNNRIEIWGSYTTTRSGFPPCDPVTSVYLSNTQNVFSGVRLRFKVYDLSTEAFVQGLTDVNLGNKPGHVWSDYSLGTMSLAPVFNLGTRIAVYYGTQDQYICDNSNLGSHWNIWAASGIRFLRIVPDGSTYKGWASAMFLNIKNPNWTCAWGTSNCYATGPLKYGFVGAYPAHSSPSASTIHFYVNVWGTFSPNPP